MSSWFCRARITRPCWLAPRTTRTLETARIIARSNADLEASLDIKLPAQVAEAIAEGQNPLRVIREWRGWTQVYLGEMKTNIGQSTISALENGTRRGTLAVWKQLADVLKVPMEILIPD